MKNLDDHWPSSKGLSVYNALSMSRRDMTAQQIREYLRSSWDDSVSEAYVQEGIVFLLKKGWVRDVSGVVTLTVRTPGRRTGPACVKVKGETDLRLMGGGR